MKVDSDPLNVDASYVKVFDCNVIEIADAAGVESIPEKEYEKKVQKV
ncbi:hypothetical protein A2U01_0101752, partial [Trifolium medium]|nr:hypothetical protein [Trifolium medium]